MDAKVLSPFIEAAANVLPQLGFKNISRSGFRINPSSIQNKGIIVLVSISGLLEGNIIYNLQMNDAKNIVCKMMHKDKLDVFDEVAQSALGELANMLTANASILLEHKGIKINISPPTVLFDNFFATKNPDVVNFAVDLRADNSIIEINLPIVVKTTVRI